jgi:hypothetical protein
LDTEWLLSTLFDASLLSTSKAAGNGGSFLRIFRQIAQQPKVPAKLAIASPEAAGNHKFGCSWTLGPARAMICSS